jgi:hypothetical protein
MVDRKLFFSKALGAVHQYDANDVVDLTDFIKNAGPPGGNVQLGVAHRLALRCRPLPDAWPLWCPPLPNAGWKLTWHTWTEAMAVLQDLQRPTTLGAAVARC